MLDAELPQMAKTAGISAIAPLKRLDQLVPS